MDRLRVRASGRGEIYVQAFPGPGAKFQISTEGGDAPLWRADGKELLFLSPDGRVMAAPIQTSPSFEAGTPRTLFQESLKLERLALSPDGQRLLVRISRAAPAANNVRLILNWPAELK